MESRGEREKCEAKANIVVLSIKLILNPDYMDLYITFFLLFLCASDSRGASVLLAVWNLFSSSQ